MTVDSSATGYATAADVLKAFDYRLVADLCSDRRGISPSQAALKDGNHDGGKKLRQAINAASGLIEAAAMQGKRYTPDDLNSLTGVGREHLKNLTAGLAMTILGERRWRLTGDQNHRFVDERSAQLLERLRLGEHVFSFTESREAGAGLSVMPMNDATSDLTRTTVLAERYFGTRGRR